MTSRLMRIKSANTCDSGGAASTPAGHQNPQDASATAHHSRDVTGTSDAAALNLCAIGSQHITWTEGFRVKEKKAWAAGLVVLSRTIWRGSELCLDRGVVLGELLVLAGQHVEEGHQALRRVRRQPAHVRRQVRQRCERVGLQVHILHSSRAYQSTCEVFTQSSVQGLALPARQPAHVRRQVGQHHERAGLQVPVLHERSDIVAAPGTDAYYICPAASSLLNISVERVHRRRHRASAVLWHRTRSLARLSCAVRSSTTVCAGVQPMAADTAGAQVSSCAYIAPLPTSLVESMNIDSEVGSLEKEGLAHPQLCEVVVRGAEQHHRQQAAQCRLHHHPLLVPRHAAHCNPAACENVSLLRSTASRHH